MAVPPIATLAHAFAWLLLAIRAAGPPACAATLETPGLRFDLDDQTGAWRLLDRRADLTWTSDPASPRFAEGTFRWLDRRQTGSLVPHRVQAATESLLLEFQPFDTAPGTRLRVRIECQTTPPALAFRYESDPGLTVESLRLLDHALPIAGSDPGYALVPVREGLWIPANSGRAFTHRFDTYAYEGCHLQMAGLVRQGAALLLTWSDPYVALELRSQTNAVIPAGDQVLSTSLILRESAREIRLQPLGSGDHVTIAKAYRDLARQRGLLVPWDRKLGENPERAKFLGAVNYKLWSALDRRMNEASTEQRSVRVNWTFAEAAEVAEHLKNDLRLDRVLFGLGGWIHRGYDNQHPDVLPAAPECGGNPGLADCARRVLALGYLLALHDNYQDIYRDAPSWDERWVNKNRDGSLTQGGAWAGGRAYVTCAEKALELARRPQNLPAVRELTHANSYFIDTTYAAGLYECFDPAHPMTRADDLRWKVALSDYARDLFGSFGSECGREWAIPHADFFEGLTGVSGRGFHDAGLQEKLGATLIPLFELVYHDTIAAYGKYGYDPAQAADYVRQHLLLGRPLHHHNVPPHRYWRQQVASDQLPARPSIARFTANGPRAFDIRYRWEVDKTPTRDWRIFVHFTDSQGRIVFQNDHPSPTPTSRWSQGSVEIGPFTVQVPEAAQGDYSILIGAFDPASGERARLPGSTSSERSYRLGTLQVASQAVSLQPTAPPPAPRRDLALFTQADGGWAEDLHPFDRFVKNTAELLGVFNELTARLPMTGHEFLDPTRQVQRTVFGDRPEAYEVRVNHSDGVLSCASRHGGEVTLPPGGLLAEGPDFAAFVALSWNGQTYTRPTFFTLRALDGRPLRESHQVRVFHGFGDAALSHGGKVVNVPREAVLRP